MGKAQKTYRFGRAEILNYAYLYDGITDPALKMRAKYSLEYYINKATFYKALWGTLSFLGIVLPAAATFAAAIDKLQPLVAGITFLTTVTSGALALFKCADKKSSYRNCAENLKSELSTYLGRTGGYQDPENRDQLLSERLERIIKEGYRKIEELDSTKSSEKGTEKDTQKETEK